MATPRGRLAIVLGLLALSSSCMDEETEDGAAELRADVHALQAEVDLHHETLLEATSLAEVEPELDRHEAAMDSMMGRTRRHMNEMRHCSGGGMTELGHAISELELELGFHRQQLEAARAFDQVLTACADYSANAGEILNGMAISADDGCLH